MYHLTKKNFKNRIDYLSLMIPEIAKKFGLTETETRIIMNSQWEFVRDNMTSKTWDGIKLKRIGSFKFNPYKLAKTIAYKAKLNKARMAKLGDGEIKDGKQSGQADS